MNYIYTNGEYVVLLGAKLYIFKTDGMLVACRSDLRYAGRITFLSDNRMLLCSSKAVFHMVNLCDGCDIWTAPYTKCELNVSDIALSPNELFAYTHDEWKGCHFISRLDLQTHDVEIHTMYMDRGATMDIFCDEDGVPCLLKTVFETIGGKPYHQNGVRIHDFFDISPGGTSCWKTKWSFEGKKYAFHFWDSSNSVITNDLQIYEPSSEMATDLLVNESVWQRPDTDPSDCWLDTSRRYLCLMYRTANVVIDIQARKVAAQYAADLHRGVLDW